MSRYNREGGRGSGGRWEQREENRPDYYRDNSRREDQERHFSDRASQGFRFDRDEADRRRFEEQQYGNYDRGGRSGREETENTWGSGRHGFSKSESEDWRHLDNYWNDMYGEQYPGRAEFSGRPSGQQSRYGQSYGQGSSRQGGYGQGGYGQGGYDVGSLGQDRYGGGDRNASGRTFTGRGPKGYKRADDRIQEDINEQLTRHAEIDATDIEVSVQDGEVTLRGQVDQRYMKRVAEDIADDVSGVKNVHNEIRVRQQQTMGGTTQQSPSGKKENAA